MRVADSGRKVIIIGGAGDVISMKHFIKLPLLPIIGKLHDIVPDPGGTTNADLEHASIFSASCITMITLDKPSIMWILSTCGSTYTIHIFIARGG